MAEVRLSRPGIFWVALGAVLIFGASCFAELKPFKSDTDTDRPGMDYKSEDFVHNYLQSCVGECDWDSKCQAWSMCKIGEPDKYRCSLKSGVPKAVKREGCLSGLKVDIGDPTKGGSARAGRFLLTDRAAGCAKLVDFVTASPLPTTGVGWDYNVQLKATGGVAPVKFLTPYRDPFTGVQKALSCSSGGATSGPAYHPGKMMVDGLTITCDGRIIGQPKAPGYFTVTIVATDSCVSAQKIEKKFVLQVKGPS